MVKEAIHHILVENLQGKEYNSEEATEWSKEISDAIKTKLKGKWIEVKAVFRGQHNLSGKVSMHWLNSTVNIRHYF